MLLQAESKSEKSTGNRTPRPAAERDALVKIVEDARVLLPPELLLTPYASTVTPYERWTKVPSLETCLASVKSPGNHAFSL